MEIDSLNQYKPPSHLELYEHLRSDFITREKELSDEIAKLKRYMKNLLEGLEHKKQKTFDPIEESFEIFTSNVEVISKINELIKAHNTLTDNHQKKISASREAIEEYKVLESMTEYQQKKDEVNAATNALEKNKAEAKKLDTEVREIEKDIEEHRRPADELNTDIRAYLGRDELTFEIQDYGYQIRRNGTPAKNLSEGEITAIAFLYFLKSLEDKSFSLKEGIVVIDDPVSSLDSNALYHAFGFMKDKTKNAGQLFILTHNHSFFRQVKNWFNYKNKKTAQSNFYMLTSNVNNDNRSSSISNLDKLLIDYESEYHYLFSLVYKAVNSTEESSLQQNYHLPNIARRLLESFLAFRKPSKNQELRQKLDDIDFDMAKKNKIIRFLHTYSHASQISEPEHDLSILSETKTVLSDLLCLLQKEDKSHFDEMKKLLQEQPMISNKTGIPQPTANL